MAEVSFHTVGNLNICFLSDAYYALLENVGTILEGGVTNLTAEFFKFLCIYDVTAQG